MSHVSRVHIVWEGFRRHAGELVLGGLVLGASAWLLHLALVVALGGAGAWLGHALWGVAWAAQLNLARSALGGRRPRLADALLPLSRPLPHLAFGLLATSGIALFGVGVVLTAAPLVFVPMHLRDGASLGEALRASALRACRRPAATACGCLALLGFNAVGSVAQAWGLCVTIPLSALALASAHERVPRPDSGRRRTRASVRGATLLEYLLAVALACALLTTLKGLYGAVSNEALEASQQVALISEGGGRAGSSLDRAPGGDRAPGRHQAPPNLAPPAELAAPPELAAPSPCGSPGDCAGKGGSWLQRRVADLASVARSTREVMRSLGAGVQSGVQWLEGAVDTANLRASEGAERWAQGLGDRPVLGSLARAYAFVDEQQRYFAGGVVKGLVNLVGGGVQGLVDPISTVEGLAALATSPEARVALIDGLVEPYEKAWAEGRYAEIPARLSVDLGSIVTGAPKAIDAVGKLTRVARVAHQHQPMPSPLARAKRAQEPRCFGAGTPVLTPSGPQPIEAIQQGDWVYSRDPRSGEVAAKRVLATHVTPGRALVSVAVRGSTSPVLATPGHPFWVEGAGWTAAAELANGRRLAGLSPAWDAEQRAGGGDELRRLRANGVTEVPGLHPVYNLTVEEFHTFFVGELGVWVHNTGVGGLDCSSKAARGVGLGIRNTATALRSASEAWKGTTRLGHALSKHAGRPGGANIWGKVTGNPSTWHGQAMQHFRDIMRGPGSFQRVTNSKGTTFFEKTLPDGRGMRLQLDYRFKGFID